MNSISRTQVIEWSVNLALIVAGLLIALIVAEIGLRLVGVTGEQRVDTSVATVADPQLGMRLVADQDGVDRRGFNNQLAVATATVVALGDSHTYGGHTSQGRPDISWPAQLAAETNTTVYNMGIWGYGMAHYRALFDQALSLEPETIVIGVYLGNDVFNAYDSVYHFAGWENYRAVDFIDSNPRSPADAKRVSLPFKSVREFWRNHSVVYRLAGNYSRPARELLGVSKPLLAGTTEWASADKDVPLLIEAGEQSTLFWVSHRVAGLDTLDANVQEGWRLSTIFLEEMAAAAAAAEVDLVLALFPSKMTPYFPLVEEQSLTNDIYERIITHETVIRLNLFAQCEALAITCVDVAPALTAALQAGIDIYPDDRDDHPLPVGYGIYATEIAAALPE